MIRLRGLSDVVRDLAPPAVTELFALLTHLGDPPFLLAIVAVYYWLADDRRSPALLVGFALVAVALTIFLKNGLAQPRPPAAVQAVAPETESYGFPSGHAIGATVVYGGLVAVDARLRNRKVVAGLAALVALVGLSRVVIGVHYLGDVVVGHAVGLAVVAALWYTPYRRRTLAAATGSVIAVLAVAVTESGPDPLFTFGGALGATAVFATVDVDELPTVDGLGPSVVLVAAGLALLGGTYALALAVGHPLAVVTAGGVMIGGALLLPGALGLVNAG
ncbi:MULTISPECIES: phosphatase PAP2 family protein [Salinibaculum]|uniref:phosphatase PAP2 family protein n=1 Tax=Salinibaculum TaxID=2732368 RepID=UPI0030D1DF57